MDKENQANQNQVSTYSTIETDKVESVNPKYSPEEEIRRRMLLYTELGFVPTYYS